MNRTSHAPVLHGMRRTLLVIGGVLIMGACGSSATKASNTPTSNSPASVSPASSSSATNTSAVVKSAMTKNGQALVDAKGMTLYTLTNGGKAVPCTGACAGLWPPLTTSSTNPTGGAGVTGLATQVNANGTQVTHDGLPLYRYSGDTAPGDANGEGLQGFGGTWHVAVTSTSRASGPVTTVPPTSASSGGGAYGY